MDSYSTIDIMFICIKRQSGDIQGLGGHTSDENQPPKELFEAFDRP